VLGRAGLVCAQALPAADAKCVPRVGVLFDRPDPCADVRGDRRAPLAD